MPRLFFCEYDNTRYYLFVAVLKEFTCSCCGDFEGFVHICPKCGKIAKRAFRTAPGVSSGKARRTDKLLESEFEARGITNFSNADPQNPKVTFRESPQVVTRGGVTAMWGDKGLQGFNQAHGTNLAIPQMPAGNTTIPEERTVTNSNLGALRSRTKVIASHGSSSDLRV
jgi:hypothetical protein